MKKLICLLTALICLMPLCRAEELRDELAGVIQNELMSAVTSGTDAWSEYLLGQSVSVGEISEGRAAVSVAAWDPGEEQDGAVMPLDEIIRNIGLSSVGGNIRYSLDASGNLSVFGVDAFRRKIISAANKAKASFNGEWLGQAIYSRIFPRVYGELGGYTDEYEQLAAQYGDRLSPRVLESVLTLQKPVKMDASDGPKALKITLERANIAIVARNAYVAAYDILKNTDKSNSFPTERISEILNDCFVQTAISVPDEDYDSEAEARADMESIMNGDLTNQAVIDYAAQIEDTLSEKLSTLKIAASYLPDYPARNQPESGVIKGAVSGTHVVFVSPDDGYGRTVSLLIPQTRQEALKLFIRSGDTVNAYVPSGTYILEYGKGSEWYGEIKRFGSEAAYASSIVSLGIAQSDKYHVISFLGNAEDDANGIKLPMRSEKYVEPD